MSEENSEESKLTQGVNPGRGKAIIWTTVVIVGLGILFFLYWLIWLRYSDSTDDSYVHGNKVRITSQIEGIVTSVNTDETFLVKEGELIVELDKTDNTIRLEYTKTALAETVRQVTEMFLKVDELYAQLQRANTEVVKAQVDYDNRAALVNQGGVSKENYIHSELDLDAAKFQVDNLKFQLMQAIAAVENTTIATHPLVREQAANVTQAWVDLARCEIRAAQSGIVAQKAVQVGQHVRPDDLLLAIVPLNQMWVYANFKEDHLSQVRIGQRVEVVSDIYGSECIYNGTVTGIAGGTGAVFSIIPPQNATGNWIKIVQRVPVRIDLDESEIERFPLRLGLSMHVTVSTKDQHGSRIPPVSKDKPVYFTDVFKDQEAGAKALIHRIIAENTANPNMRPPEIHF